MGGRRRCVPSTFASPKMQGERRSSKYGEKSTLECQLSELLPRIFFLDIAVASLTQCRAGRAPPLRRFSTAHRAFYRRWKLPTSAHLCKARQIWANIGVQCLAKAIVSRQCLTVCPNVGFGGKSRVVQYFRRGPFDGKFGSAAARIFII